MAKAIFLDRDGTIIIDKIYLNDPQQIEFIDGAVEGLALMQNLGFELIVVTNQSGVAKGIVTLENLKRIHDLMAEHLSSHGIKIRAFYYAPFPSEQPHPMRKPEPGMLLQAAADHNIDLNHSWMIGDRMTDVEAGHRAGARSLLIRGLEDPDGSSFRPPLAIVDDLIHAARIISGLS